MALQLAGNTGTIDETDATFKARRVTVRPHEALNWQSYGLVSGALTGVAAAGPVFSLRNTGANPLVVRRLAVGFATTTAFTTAQALAYGMFRALSFSASDTGGTASYTAAQNRHRSGSPFANIVSAPDIRIATTAALTPGTRTLDTVAMALAAGSSTAVGTTMPVTALFAHDPEDYPLVLAQNEGLVLANTIAMGAAGVIQLHVNLEFAEVTAF